MFFNEHPSLADMHLNSNTPGHKVNLLDNLYVLSRVQFR